MSKYKCTECKKISTGEEWDETTKNHYNGCDNVYYDDGNIDSEDRCDYYFVCPKCDYIGIDGAYIEEIDESIEVV